MIKIDNLSFSYGENKIFDKFNLKIADNGRICLFGSSGCGKTTLLRLLMGLEKSYSGSITGMENKKVSAVFQDDRLLPFLTVRENIKVVKGDEKKAEKLLECLNISDAADKYPDDLSGGMKRRAAIARALSVDFQILFLDEPFNGLDEQNIKTASEVINEYTKDKTVILVSHSHEQAKMLDTEIIDIKK